MEVYREQATAEISRIAVPWVEAETEAVEAPGRRANQIAA